MEPYDPPAIEENKKKRDRREIEQAPKGNQVIDTLTHVLMTARDDLTPVEEGRAAWARIFDLLVKYDLCVSAVTISHVPRDSKEAEAAMLGQKKDTSPVLPFGKYKGKTVMEVRSIDAGWLRWAMANVQWRDDRIPEAITKALNS